MSLRRFSSAKNDISMRRCGIGVAFEICLAKRPAARGPSFLAPIRRETVAHQHRLDAWVAQHRVTRRLAAVKIGEVVGLEDRSATFDIGVVAVEVLPRNEVTARVESSTRPTS